MEFSYCSKENDRKLAIIAHFGPECFYFLFNLQKYSSSNVPDHNVSFTLMEEYRLRVFENNVMRNLFVPGQRSCEGWSRLNNGELHDLHSLKIHAIQVIKLIRFLRVWHVVLLE